MDRDTLPKALVNRGHESETAWYGIDQVLAVVRKSLAGEWQWPKNSRCKYIEVRIDMRSGLCLLRDGHGQMISMEELFRQNQG